MPGAVGAQLAVLAAATPNSIVNQKTSARNCSASSVSQRRAASPASRLTSANSRVGEQVAVADHLVDQVGLGRVERRGRVADVLRRVERRGRRASRRTRRAGRARRPARSGSPSAARAAALTSSSCGIAVARQVERGDRLAEGAARVALVLRARARGRPCARPPARPRCTRSAAAGSPGRPGQRGGGDLVAPLAVRGIVGAGVVVAEVDDHARPRPA